MKFMFVLGFMLISAMFVSCGGNEDKGTDESIDTQVDTEKDSLEAVNEIEPFDHGVDTLKDIIETTIDVNEVTDQGTDHSQTETVNPDAAIITNCPEIAFCYLEKDESQCNSLINESGEAEKYNTLLQCLTENNCSAAFENDQFSACLEDNCMTEKKECFSGGELSCKNIYKCRKECLSTDEEPFCPEKCLADGTNEAQNKFIELKNCIFNADCAKDTEQLMDNGWPEWTCENWIDNHECPLQYSNCIPPI